MDDIANTLAEQKKRREAEIAARKQEYELACRRLDEQEKWNWIFTFLTEKAEELPP